jgi:hypothetical protein
MNRFKCPFLYRVDLYRLVAPQIASASDGSPVSTQQTQTAPLILVSASEIHSSLQPLAQTPDVHSSSRVDWRTYGTVPVELQLVFPLFTFRQGPGRQQQHRFNERGQTLIHSLL